jgi:segregation and condensation protein B
MMSEKLSSIKQIVEVCLLTATNPISIEQLLQLFDHEIDEEIVRQVLQGLKEEYYSRGVELVKLATGYRFRSKVEFQSYINKLNQVRPPRYSRTTMETLAIIAYRQPVTRGEIEDIRGVSVNTSVIQNLIERNWIEIVGYKAVPGKPALFATTANFLTDLGLNSLEDLPPLVEITPESLQSQHDIIEEYDLNKEDIVKEKYVNQ